MQYNETEKFALILEYNSITKIIVFSDNPNLTMEVDTLV